MEFVLIHSPVLGPRSWRWVADELEASGHGALVPDLRDSVLTGDPAAFVDAAVAQTGPDRSGLTVAGHSGAGFFLPMISARLDAAHTVYVDAGIPPGTRGAPGGDFLEHLRSLAAGGILPAWSAWWGSDMIAELVPEGVRRAAIESEMPRVPLAFYETPMDLPADWAERPSSMLLLSEAYRDDADRAASLGWPVIESLGGHLDIVNRAPELAAILGNLASGAAT